MDRRKVMRSASAKVFIRGAAKARRQKRAVNQWQVAGIRRAMGSLDRGKGVPHARVKQWVESWGTANERPLPKRSTRNAKSGNS
jgi:predicted transcriptional regulator